MAARGIRSETTNISAIFRVKICCSMQHRLVSR